MLFSSPLFIFLFLPLVLGIYFLLPRSLWNLWLLLASLFFYAWGERAFTLIMVASISINYVFGLLVEHFRNRPGMKLCLVLAVVANLALLVAFKYANFLVDSFNILLATWKVPPFQLAPVHLPLGISFFTFHALSYVIDVYRRDAVGQKDFVKVALYVTLFPQLIAGPILRFHNVADQFVSRSVNLPLFTAGIRLFLVGFCKKILIANNVAIPADAIFSLPADALSPGVAWLGIICYSLQIYFDFSGYSDMAIGLGRMLGFHFPENFNYPYISKSIREFWRRWHISLSTWFRDYLYIPLGGNRVSTARSYGNLVAVFLLCGLWHGASWTFLAWGAYHGLFLTIERAAAGRFPSSKYLNLPAHLYAMLVVMVGWVFFRANDFPHAIAYLKAMSGYAIQTDSQAALSTYFSPDAKLAVLAGIIASTPLFAKLWNRAHSLSTNVFYRETLSTVQTVGLLAIFILSLSFLAAGTYNPFIYFRF